MSFRLLIQDDNGESLAADDFGSEGAAEEAAKMFINDDNATSVTVLRPIATFRPKRVIERVPFMISGNGDGT